MHNPVLANEVVELLSPEPGDVFIDGTIGSGGHAAMLIRRLGPEGRLIGIDRDREALERTRRRLGDLAGQCRLSHARFSEMRRVAAEHRVDEVNGVLLDIGVSSEQLDAPERGMSFAGDGPLDMRMDRSSGITAGDLVNGLSEEELAEVFKSSESRNAAKRIARSVVNARRTRPIETTGQLAEIVTRAKSGRRGRIHPATRAFQALRIAVNNELAELIEGLEAGIGLLAEGGRMAVISFHSLEDGIVKKCFREHAGHWESLQEGGRQWCVKEPEVKILTRKPVIPSARERTANPRSRSAKLRAVKRQSRQE